MGLCVLYYVEYSLYNVKKKPPSIFVFCLNWFEVILIVIPLPFSRALVNFLACELVTAKISLPVSVDRLD